MTFARAGVVSLVLAFALSGCAERAPEASPTSPGPSPSQSTPTPSTPPTSAPSPTPPVAVPSIPACGDLLAVEQVRVTVNETRIEGPQQGSSLAPESLPGPLARGTYLGARDTLTCGYGIPQSDGIVAVTVTVIEPAAGEELTQALTMSDQYTHTTRGEIDLFSTYISDGIGTYLGYAIRGPAWAIVQGTLVNETTSVNLAADAVTAVLAAPE